MRIFTFSFLIFFVSANVYSQSPKRELRGAWLTTYYNIDWPDNSQDPQQQQQSLISILDNYKVAGINAVFMQVRNQCDAMYKSTIEPWSSDLTGAQGLAPFPAWDPLAFAIQECHKRAIEMHAWLNPYRAIGNVANLSAFSTNHVARQHPEWLLANGNLRTLNPGLPEVRQYILKIVKDIVQRYDIDGIHFDDYFYPEGYVNDDETFEKYNNGSDNKADWRRENINLLIKSVHNEINELKSWVKFGISPSGIYRNSTDPSIGSASSGLEHYTTYFADTRKWLQEGWIDYLIPQVYWYFKQPGSAYQAIVQWWQHESFGRHIYIGIGTYKMGNGEQAWQNASEVARQITYDRSFPAIGGQSFYNSSSFLSNKLGVLDTIKKMYSIPAIVPVMPWKKMALPAAPENLRINSGLRNVVLQWSSPVSEDHHPKYYVIYRSTDQRKMNEAINIRSVVGDTTFTDLVTDTALKFYYAVSTLNRLQYESDLSAIVSTNGKTIPATITIKEITQNNPVTVSEPAEVVLKKEMQVIKDSTAVKPVSLKLINLTEQSIAKGTDLNIKTLVAGNLIYSIFKEQTRITWGKIKTARSGVSINLPGTRELEVGKYSIQMEMDRQKQYIPFEVR